jgi:hypothetical protein
VTTVAPPSAATRPAEPARAARPAGRPLDLAVVFTAGAALGGWLIGLKRLSDNSFLVHLLTGRIMAEGGGIPRHDVYSFTAPGHAFLAQSWLVEWIYGRLDAWWGGLGIRVFIGLIGALIFGMLYRLALHVTGDRRRAAGVLLVVYGGAATIFNERPLAVGLLALVCAVWCVELPDTWLGRRPAIALPVILWVWANSHGSWSLGFVYLALHLVGRWVDGARPWQGREREVLTGAGVALVALCVNPYGFGLLWFPVELVRKGDILANVLEWMSPNFHYWGLMLFALVMVVGIVAFARGRRPSWRDVIVVVPFWLLGLWALRNIGIAAVVTLPALARAVAPDPDQPTRVATPLDAASVARPIDEARTARLFLTAVVGLGLLLTLGLVRQPSFDTRAFSVRAWEAVQHAGLEGHNLLTTDANAAYVQLRAWPHQRTFMDDRYDMFPSRVVKDYDELLAGGPRWRRILDQYRVDVVIWPRTKPLTSLLAEDHRWRVVHRDKDWVAFARPS